MSKGSKARKRKQLANQPVNPSADDQEVASLTPRAATPTQPKPVQPTNLLDSNIDQSLSVLRVIWVLFLINQLVVIVVGLYFMGQVKGQPISTNTAWRLTGLCGGLLVVFAMAGGFARNQIYKRFWQGNVVTPTGYFMANVLVFGLMDAVVIVSVAVMILARQPWPALVPGLLAFALYLVNFPHGKPMKAAAVVLNEPLYSRP